MDEDEALFESQDQEAQASRDDPNSRSFVPEQVSQGYGRMINIKRQFLIANTKELKELARKDVFAKHTKPLKSMVLPNGTPEGERTGSFAGIPPTCAPWR